MVKIFTILSAGLLTVCMGFVAQAQVTNLKVNGFSANFTTVQGDSFRWEYNLPVGGVADCEIWIDLNSNGVIDSSTDKLLFGNFTQTDGQANNNNGPGDMDSLANGYILFTATNIGFAPTKYILRFTNNNVGQSISGTVTALPSPTYTISGKVTPPPGKSKKNISLNADERNAGDNGAFWSALTDTAGNYTINFDAAAGGLQWRVRVNDQFPPYTQPSDTTITLTGNITGLNFTFGIPSAKVVGFLKGEDGHVFANAEVRSNPQSNGGNNNDIRATTDANGFFQIGYTAGEISSYPIWSLEANDNNVAPMYFPPFVSSISIHLNDSLRIDLIAPLADDSITGTVTIDGHAPSNQSFTLYASSNDSGQTRTNSDPTTGKYKLHVINKIYNYSIGIENQTIPNGYGYNRNTPQAHPGNNNINIAVVKAGWLMQSSGTFNQLTSVSFVNATTGWVAGSNGTVLKTTDTGATWTSQATSTSATITGIHFANTTTGWFVGDGGVIKNTTNGGTNWNPQNSTTTNDLKAIQFLNANTGWVVGGCTSPGNILKTTNGGSSWVAQSPGITNCPTAISFVDANKGWAVGGSSDVFTTTDGGANWSSQFIGGCGLRSVSFVDANNGWVVGSCGDILHTTDGGASWSSQSSGGCGFNSVFFINSTTGWAVGDCQDIYRTTNAGATWTYQVHNSNNGYSFNAVNFVDANNGWTVGGNGTILHSTSGGILGVRESQLSMLPTAFTLSQNYPNPFNPSTVIKYSVSSRQFISLKVYNVLGQEIETLVNGEKTPGEYNIEWHTNNLPSGVYFYRFSAGENISIKKMLLMK